MRKQPPGEASRFRLVCIRAKSLAALGWTMYVLVGTLSLVVVSADKLSTAAKLDHDDDDGRSAANILVPHDVRKQDHHALRQNHNIFLESGTVDGETKNGRQESEELGPLDSQNERILQGRRRKKRFRGRKKKNKGRNKKNKKKYTQYDYTCSNCGANNFGGYQQTNAFQRPAMCGTMRSMSKIKSYCRARYNYNINTYCCYWRQKFRNECGGYPSGGHVWANRCQPLARDPYTCPSNMYTLPEPYPYCKPPNHFPVYPTYPSHPVYPVYPPPGPSLPYYFPPYGKGKGKGAAPPPRPPPTYYYPPLYGKGKGKGAAPAPIPRPPTSKPTSKPIEMQPPKPPTKSPIKQPTKEPSATPSSMPSPSPTEAPSSDPSASPTLEPSASPTNSPSAYPSSSPSRLPSSSPSSHPSLRPSSSPSSGPTSSPSEPPSDLPSLHPSSSPSDAPTISSAPSVSARPSSSPSVSVQPSEAPSASPSGCSESKGTGGSSKAPKGKGGSSKAPKGMGGSSKAPKGGSSKAPKGCSGGSKAPKGKGNKSSKSSKQPSSSPSEQPSTSPSDNPSESPSDGPSFLPSTSPSGLPSVIPSRHPSNEPSVLPSDTPSSAPSEDPSSEPSQLPSRSPSSIPSGSPTSMAPDSGGQNPTPAPACPDKNCTTIGLTLEENVGQRPGAKCPINITECNSTGAWPSYVSSNVTIDESESDNCTITYKFNIESATQPAVSNVVAAWERECCAKSFEGENANSSKLEYVTPDPNACTDGYKDETGHGDGEIKTYTMVFDRSNIEPGNETAGEIAIILKGGSDDRCVQYIKGPKCTSA